MLELLTPVAGWALGKVADTLWESGTDQVKATLAKPQLNQALKDSLEAVRKWEKTLPTPELLFYRCDERRAGQFLERVFADAGVMEQLQRPLAQQGEPDRELLRRYFEVVATETDTKIVAASLPDWLRVFCCAYFEQTALFIKYQVGRQRYLQQLALWYDDVKFLGISVASQEREKSQKLLQIFVMPDVKARAAEGARRLAEPEMAAGLETRQAQLLAEQRQLSALLEQEGKTFSARELLRQGGSGRCVLLGAPGSGKTTLMSYFAVMLAQGETQGAAQGEALAAAGLAADALPLVVRIREWTEKRDLGLLAFAQWFAETRLAVPGLPAGFFEYWLEQGKALILLDGLDEVANEAHRDQVVNQIECFLQQAQYRQNPAIITSRPAGYKQAYFRTEEFPHYDLQPFDEEKIGQFIENWYDNREADREVSQRHQAELKQALTGRDRIQLLAKNPLLLTIITLIHRDRASLPRRRHELYDCAVETLLIEWDVHKGLDVHKDPNAWPLEYLRPDALLRLMERLAYWIHTQGSTGDREGGTLIDRAELIVQLGSFIAEEADIQPYKAKAEAKRFLKHIRNRTGLLNEQGQDRYAFVHKTFQEHLAAKEISYLHSTNRSIHQYHKDGFKAVESHIEHYLHVPHWQEVLLLLIAQQSKDRIGRVLRQVLAHPTLYEQWLHRNLFFAAACLAEVEKLPSSDVLLVDSILKPLVEIVVSESLLTSQEIRVKASESLTNMKGTDFEKNAMSLLEARSSQISPIYFQQLRAALGQKTIALQNLLKLLNDPSASVRSHAAALLGQLGAGSDVLLSGLLDLLNDPSASVRSHAAALLGQLGMGSDVLLSILLDLLERPEFHLRSEATFVLVELGAHSDAVFTSLVSLLQSSDFHVRLRATLVFVELGAGSDAMLSIILSLLESPDSNVRSKAASLSVKFKESSKAMIRALLKLFEDPDSSVRSSARYALVTIGAGSEDVLNGLLELLKNPDSSVRYSAADALGQLGTGSEDVLRILLERLEATEADVRSSAASALGQLEIGSDGVHKSLLKLLKDPEADVRCSAASALGQLGVTSDAALNSLPGLLKDPDFYVRNSAANALGQIGTGSDAVLSALLSLLRDPETCVCCSAAHALGQLGIGSEAVLSGLLELLKFPEASVCCNAAHALGQLRIGSDAVLSGLLDLLKFPEASVRSNAAYALEQVGRQMPGAAERVAGWVEQHQGDEFVGEGVDVLWQLVVEQA